MCTNTQEVFPNHEFNLNIYEYEYEYEFEIKNGTVMFVLKQKKLFRNYFDSWIEYWTTTKTINNLQESVAKFDTLHESH